MPTPATTLPATTAPPSAQALRDFRALPSLASQLPLRFASGFHVFELHLGCPHCGTIAPEPAQRGTVTLMSATLAQIDATVHCHACRRWNPVNLRLYDDGRLMVRAGDGWHTQRVRLRWWMRLLHRFGINPALRCRMEPQ